MVPPAIERFITALATIQTRTDKVISVPNIAETTNGQVRDIHRVARLIDGDIHVGKWRHEAIEGVTPGAMSVGDYIQIQLDIPLRVDVDGTVHEVGTVEQTILSAAVVEVDDTTVHVEPDLNDTVHERLVREPQAGWAPAGKTAVRSRPHPTVAPPTSEASG
jgi:hypothetical protein